MGQTLSEPVVDKTSSEGEDDCCIYGVSAMQGWRISMEDAHAAVLDLHAKYTSPEETSTDPAKRLAFFGVYDGHGGDKVALFAGENVHKIVAKQDSFAKGDIEQALKDGFLATDRAILEGEKARISAAGGFVDFGRVNGNLALSRAIGDFEFKKSPELAPEQQIVTAYPDVTVHELSDDDEFLVIACIWDCQSSQAVVEFVRRGIAAKQELYRICENMMDNCLASNSETGGVGCDNMTMIIIGLLNGRTKEECGDAAEFRGPGIRNQFEENPDDYDMENDRARGFSVRSGRIILLGDGTELVPDQNDEELFDQTEEDRDLPSQVQRELPDSARNEREGTPGPQSKTDATSKSEEGSSASTSESTVTPAGSSTSGAPEKSTS
ncbi:unnamed protein product [Aspergillus oryzae]|uniref:protein-serine/threonine phosphatase n=2 Tax=Aspergillus oryzae TaxID=5062 RepID=A0AAN4YRE7_ASPOZ|nr:unnamed protein product [Aspergillus oryzae]GMF94986.1 unnamed protein product [Aspergillus oryzae]GMG14049.1 unnamed protein product [Aspergillus oryzae]GMG31775.1 unnamed protein product [Aspergillus oryzae]GMG51605.1 unnamed protein product [Aspergillus oryzae var. brunneus]